ncbi:MAG: hypothetical protein ACR2MB_12630 [Acidimicrobiales bacterium]
MTGPPAHERSLSVRVRVPGADCSWCFNEAIEHVLQLNGVKEIHGSITSACLEVTGTGFSAASILDTLRTYLHGIDNSSHECQMIPVDPQLVTLVDEQEELESLAPGSDRTTSPMETLTEAMQRLRAKGFVHDLRASQGGQLRCGTCGSFSDPESVAIAETIRFEGDSNPDDEAILIAVVCPGGCLAQFSAAFGPTAAALDTEVLQRLAHVASK